MVAIDPIPSEISMKIKAFSNISLKNRLKFWAEYFIGTPYSDSPLGEGDQGPRLRFDVFDCMTYVETCLALATADRTEDILPNLDKIRYHDGVVSFHKRNHFISVDWLPNNFRLLSPRNDLADSVLHRIIDRAKFFSEKRKPIPASNPLSKPVKIEFPYISPTKLTGLAAEEIDGSIILFVGRLEWLVVTHMGFVFELDGVALLFHASSKLRRVATNPLASYLRSNPGSNGGVLVQPRFCNN